MRIKYYIKRAAVITAWLAVMGGLLYGTVKGDIDLRNMLSGGDFPYYIEGAPEAVTFPININTATVRELKKLEGIGDAKAEEIIAYRGENGGFKTVDELINVKGIGESTLNKIREFITV